MIWRGPNKNNLVASFGRGCVIPSPIPKAHCLNSKQMVKKVKIDVIHKFASDFDYISDKELDVFIGSTVFFPYFNLQSSERRPTKMAFKQTFKDEKASKMLFLPLTTGFRSP